MTDTASRASDLADRAAAPVYGLVYDGDDEARVCRDIPDAACRHQPRNVVMSAAALALTKTGDRLMDPKIVLAWMITALGAPAALVGFLSPVRESLALLPQLLIAKAIRARPRRKGFWALGSLGQAASLVAMAVCALLLEGLTLGLSVLALLALFAVSRGVCSVAYKDVLGKTVSKTRRGAVAGYAASAAGLAGAGVGAGLIVWQSDDPGALFFAGLLIAAAGLWALAAGVYMLVAEEDGSTEGGANGMSAVLSQLALLRTEPALRDFLIVRALLMATALATPFYVALAQRESGADLSGLGGFLIASAAASAAGGWVWGRMADASSRWVLALSGALGAASAAAVLLTLGLSLPWAGSVAFHAVAVFVLALAHEGVRLGRSTYLVDLATEETRASYTAVSNTVIGGLLLAMGAVTGALFQAAPLAAVALLGGFAAAASGLALRLKPVSG